MNNEPGKNKSWPEMLSDVPEQPWKVEFVAAKEMVMITSRGHIFREDARQQSEQASRLMREHKTHRVLADFSAAWVEVSLTDIYWFPDYFSTLGCTRRFRIAIVLPATGYRQESFEFFELRCANTGICVKLFAENTAAENWLQQSVAATSNL